MLCFPNWLHDFAHGLKSPTRLCIKYRQIFPFTSVGNSWPSMFFSMRTWRNEENRRDTGTPHTYHGRILSQILRCFFDSKQAITQVNQRMLAAAQRNDEEEVAQCLQATWSWDVLVDLLAILMFSPYHFCKSSSPDALCLVFFVGGNGGVQFYIIYTLRVWGINFWIGESLLWP